MQHVRRGAGKRSITDWNNALKLGFDPHSLTFPSQLRGQPWSHLLPQHVLQPGAPTTCMCPEVAARTGLPGSCEVVAGTTDSIAAFLAAGVPQLAPLSQRLCSTREVLSRAAAQSEPDSRCSAVIG